jgi:hypothetical protein
MKFIILTILLIYRNKQISVLLYNIMYFYAIKGKFIIYAIKCVLILNIIVFITFSRFS